MINDYIKFYAIGKTRREEELKQHKEIMAKYRKAAKEYLKHGRHSYYEIDPYEFYLTNKDIIV